jgi:hypothetical protein
MGKQQFLINGTERITFLKKTAVIETKVLLEIEG